MMTVAALSAVGYVTVSRRNEQLRETNAALVDANARVEAKRREAEEQRQEAERRRKIAETAARAANEQNRSAVDAEIALIQLLEQRLRNVPALQDVRERILDGAVKNLDAAAKAMTDLRRDIGWDAANEERNWRSLAQAHQRLGDLRRSQGRFREALDQYQQMDEIIATLAASKPENLDIQARLARSKRLLGFIAMTHLLDFEQAKDYFRRSVDISRQCLAQQPDSDLQKNELASSLGQLAGAEMNLGHLKEARDLYAEEIATRESFSPAKANLTESRRELAGLYERLGQLSFKTGDRNESQRLYDHCAALRSLSPANYPTNGRFRTTSPCHTTMLALPDSPRATIRPAHANSIAKHSLSTKSASSSTPTISMPEVGSPRHSTMKPPVRFIRMTTSQPLPATGAAWRSGKPS